MGGEYIMICYLATILVILAALLYLRKKREQDTEELLRPNQALPAGRAPRAQDRLQRARAQPERKLGGEDEDEDHESDVDGDEVDANRNLKNAAAKRLRQLEQRRRNEEKERVQGKAAKDAARDAHRKERQARFEEAERIVVEAAALRKEQKEKKEKAEFAQWNTSFATEAAGTDVGESHKNEEGLLLEFIAYIKKHKVVVIEDIAIEFKLRSTDAVSRIRALEESATITGVLDDRGKFIYLTPAELDSVASWMKDKGRMSIQEIVAECNKLINLTPSDDPPEEYGAS